MEKTRVPEGKKYWYIGVHNGIISVFMAIDYHSLYVRDEDIQTDFNFKYGNYFHTQEEAESMVAKLQAVLNGAEVIEVPTPNEVYKECKKRNPHIDEESIVGWEWQEGFFACANFMKSKII